MLRMAHRILSQGVHIGCQSASVGLQTWSDSDELKKWIQRCPVFVLDNIAESEMLQYSHPYRFNATASEISTLYPILKSPYSEAWFEFNIPASMKEPSTQNGYLVRQGPLDRRVARNPVDGITWMAITKFGTFNGQCRIMDGFKIACEKTGKIVQFEMHSLDENGDWEMCSACAEYRFMMLSPVLKAMCLCMCQNKPREDDASEEFNPPVKWTSRQRLPRLRYRVLDINGIKSPRSMNPEFIPRGSGINSLHQVRGHFATYLPERPLFGRLSGTFWIPDHIRGDVKNGVVVKDYTVSFPEYD